MLAQLISLVVSMDIDLAEIMFQCLTRLLGNGGIKLLAVPLLLLDLVGQFVLYFVGTAAASLGQIPLDNGVAHRLL